MAVNGALVEASEPHSQVCVNHSPDFWDALAPFHAAVEDSYFNLASLHRLLQEIRPPVLIVGAGQGLIVAELLKMGFQCDGIDLSAEMIRYAKLRRGITLIHADARATPFIVESYETVIYATGVIDFANDEDGIRAMLTEGRRVVRKSGKIFVAFYKLSAAQETFLERVGLLRDSVVALRQSLELYLLKPTEMISWVAERAGYGRFRATIALLRLSLFCAMQERRMTLRMQRIVRKMDDPCSFINAAPEKQPYRNERQIENLFKRLGIPIKSLRSSGSCWIAQTAETGDVPTGFDLSI